LKKIAQSFVDAGGVEPSVEAVERLVASRTTEETKAIPMEKVKSEKGEES
jgi:hypothetical protein